MTSFRDRFHVSFINYSESPGVGANGVEYKILMSLQDHSTRFTYLRPLRNGKEGEVVEELSHIFGFIGYPVVCNIAGGKTDKILKEIQKRNPDCWTVASSRQGEKLPTTAKDLLNRMVHEYKEKFPQSEMTWLQLIGLCMAYLNSCKSHGRNNISPYELLFENEYHFPTSVGTEELQLANNPAQLCLVLKNE